MLGIPLEGPDGEGLCLGYTPRADDMDVHYVQDAQSQVGTSANSCAVVRDGTYMTAPGRADGRGGPESIWFQISPRVERMIVTLQSGRQVVADTVHLPGVDGASFAAFWMGAGDTFTAPPEFITAAGDPLLASDAEADPPPGCLARPLVPTPSDSEEWETPVVDHQGQTRGRTAGLVELVAGVHAYRVVDDADLVVGYTLLDQAVGFVDREQAEDPEVLRTIVACGDEYASERTLTPACSTALSGIGIHLEPGTAAPGP
jgi:hypothetical protein